MLILLINSEDLAEQIAQEKIKFRQKVIKAEKKWRASEKGRAYFNKLNATIKELESNIEN